MWWYKKQLPYLGKRRPKRSPINTWWSQERKTPQKHKRETSRDPKSLKIKETETAENEKTSLKNQSIQSRVRNNSFLFLSLLLNQTHTPYTPQFTF